MKIAGEAQDIASSIIEQQKEKARGTNEVIEEPEGMFEKIKGLFGFDQAASTNVDKPLEGGQRFV